MSNKALVIGAGKSGINAAKLLMAHGYEVAVFDGYVSADKIKNTGKHWKCRSFPGRYE